VSPRAPLNRDLVRKRPAGRRQLETTARRPSFFLRRRLHRHGRMWRPSDGLASLFGPRLLRRRDGVVLQRSRSLEAFPTPKPRPAAAPGRSCLRRLCETRDARSGSTRACCGRLHEAPALPEEQGRHAGQGAPSSGRKSVWWPCWQYVETRSWGPEFAARHIIESPSGDVESHPDMQDLARRIVQLAEAVEVASAD